MTHRETNSPAFDLQQTVFNRHLIPVPGLPGDYLEPGTQLLVTALPLVSGGETEVEAEQPTYTLRVDDHSSRFAHTELHLAEDALTDDPSQADPVERPVRDPGDFEAHNTRHFPGYGSL